MAVRNDFQVGEVLKSEDLNDTFGAKAPLASPTFTGTPAGPTAASGTNTTQLATTAFVQSASGLVRIATQTFSAVSSVSVNGCFTSSYANYRIVCTITAASIDDQNVSLRYRASSSDNSSSNYSSGGVVGTSGDVTAPVFQLNGTSHSSMTNTTTTANRSVGFTMDVISPQLAATTSAVVNGIGFTSVTFGRFFVTTHNVASAFDGFSLFPASGTITGTIRIYGYLNS